MDDPKIARSTLDRNHLQGNAVFIIAMEYETAVPGRVVGRRLVEHQAAVLDDVVPAERAPS